MSAACQVDFYLLGPDAPGAEQLACRLALMAWERGHAVDIVTSGQQAAAAVDELLWRYPPGRFVPHSVAGPGKAAPVRIRQAAPTGPADVVINLTSAPVPEPTQYQRLLEIVPHAEAERAASRDKFRAYRALGLEPGTHEIA